MAPRAVGGVPEAAEADVVRVRGVFSPALAKLARLSEGAARPGQASRATVQPDRDEARPEPSERVVYCPHGPTLHLSGRGQCVPCLMTPGAKQIERCDPCNEAHAMEHAA